MFNLFDEMAAEEYRNDRMRDAEQHNSIAQSKQNKPTPKFHHTLGKLGASIESLGTKIKTRYSYPEPCETREMLVKPTK
jgi:hypothetical protein